MMHTLYSTTLIYYLSSSMLSYKHKPYGFHIIFGADWCTSGDLVVGVGQIGALLAAGTRISFLRE